MFIKKLSILLPIITFILCFGAIQTLAQTKIKPVGNVIVRVGSDIVLEVPVNDKIPLLRGTGYRVESSHGNSMFQIDTLAVSTKIDEAILTFRVTNQTDSKKIRYVTKKINLKKGEKKTFNFKVKLAYKPKRSYITTVFYES